MPVIDGPTGLRIIL